VNAIFIIKNFLGVITLLLTWLFIMTGTGGSFFFDIKLYLSFCKVIMGDFWKNYGVFVWIRDIGRGRLC